jgi:hypothetical protein
MNQFIDASGSFDRQHFFPKGSLYIDITEFLIVSLTNWKGEPKR